MSSDSFFAVRDQTRSYLVQLYPDTDPESLVAQILKIFDGLPREIPEDDNREQRRRTDSIDPGWTSRDSLLITYGDSLVRDDERPLQTLQGFLDTYVGDAVPSLHILPFCPFTSDDGFAVTNFRSINPTLGNWEDISRIARGRRLVADLVINHVSSEHEWFQQYIAGEKPGCEFFIEVDPSEDLSGVVRPRSSPLLRPTETRHGLKYVWCTFSHDQIDVDFRNPDVLLKFLSIIRQYLDAGIRGFRLDAIGYLWKKFGTPCIHLAETHEVVRLIRTLTDHFAPGTLIITETNVPNHENLTYFGNGNEAHLIYNFSLAPLLTHALLTGRADYLKQWMMSMPPSPPGCTFLNFTASHDGIGMRPAEGLLSEQEQGVMVETIQKHGGHASLRRMPDGTERIYELNVSLFDAFKGTASGPDRNQVERFLCSQTIMMALEGVPAFYIHSLLATPNDQANVEKTGRARSINRHRWDYDRLTELLDDPRSPQSRVLRELTRRIRIRAAQPAFHPNATQFTLQLKPWFFAFWRQSPDRQQSIFAVHNLSRRTHRLSLSELNLYTTESWVDLIAGEKLPGIRAAVSVKPCQCMWITNSPGDMAIC